MTVQSFGNMPDGREVHQITLQNSRMNVGLLSLGATLQGVSFDGAPMLMGSETLSDYTDHLQYSGATVGRVANRICKAKAVIAGKKFEFDANEVNGNCLHGGADGVSHRLWTILESGPTHVIFGDTLPDGHMGFPGRLDVQAKYELCDTILRLEITAQSDAETLCNFAPHGYWNLSGEAEIDAHELQVLADEYLPIDAHSIPTGEIKNVKETPFDFRKLRSVGRAELDHNFCLSDERQLLRPILALRSALSGVTLEVASTETGVQVYDGRHIGRAGLAIEPQVWPDAINQEGFPSMILKPGETYKAVTEFKLSKSAHS